MADIGNLQPLLEKICALSPLKDQHKKLAEYLQTQYEYIKTYSLHPLPHDTSASALLNLIKQINRPEFAYGTILLLAIQSEAIVEGVAAVYLQQCVQLFKFTEDISIKEDVLSLIKDGIKEIDINN